MDIFILMIKGFIIGIGKIIPGVSGAMLAISLGLYEKCLNAIIYFFRDVKENTKLLLSIGIGVVVAIVLGSKIIAFLLEKYFLSTIMLFIGIILGGMPNFLKKVKSYEMTNNKKTIFILCFMAVIALSFIKISNQYLIYGDLKVVTYFAMGFIDAATMIIPGLSGTAVFMLLGLYSLSLSLFSSLTTVNSIIQNIPQLLPFVFGMIIGIWIVSIIMNRMLYKHEGSTYYGILGFQMSAIIVLFISQFKTTYTMLELLSGIIFAVIGFLSGKKME